jgi:hypothetical protein
MFHLFHEITKVKNAGKNKNMVTLSDDALKEMDVVYRATRVPGRIVVVPPHDPLVAGRAYLIKIVCSENENVSWTIKWGDYESVVATSSSKAFKFVVPSPPGSRGVLTITAEITTAAETSTYFSGETLERKYHVINSVQLLPAFLPAIGFTSATTGALAVATAVAGFALWWSGRR